MREIAKVLFGLAAALAAERLFPDDPRTGLGFACIAAVLFLWLCYDLLRTKYPNNWLTRFDPEIFISPKNKYITLADASRWVYENLRKDEPDHFHVRISEPFRKAKDGILNYFASVIANNSAVFCSKPPSSILEAFDQNELQYGDFFDGGDIFCYLGDDDPIFTGFKIKNKDLKKVYGIIKSQRMPQVDRMPLTEICNLGLRYGLNLLDRNTMYHFAQRIWQAVNDDEIRMWGRKAGEVHSTLVRIEPSQYRGHWIDSVSIIKKKQDSNREYGLTSNNLEHARLLDEDGNPVYTDLHLSSESAIAWLRHGNELM